MRDDGVVNPFISECAHAKNVMALLEGILDAFGLFRCQEGTDVCKCVGGLRKGFILLAGPYFWRYPIALASGLTGCRIVDLPIFSEESLPFDVEVLLQMSRLYEPFHQIIEAPACLRSVTVLLTVLDHREELLIGYGKGCEGRPFWTALFFLPSTGRPWPVRKFGTSFRTTSGCLTGNQDLLGGCGHVGPSSIEYLLAWPEQVFHCRRRLLRERLEEWGTWTNALFEDLKDSVHASAECSVYAQRNISIVPQSFRQRVVSYIESHELSIIHDMVEGVAGPILVVPLGGGRTFYTMGVTKGQGALPRLWLLAALSSQSQGILTLGQALSLLIGLLSADTRKVLSMKPGCVTQRFLLSVSLFPGGKPAFVARSPTVSFRWLRAFKIIFVSPSRRATSGRCGHLCRRLNQRIPTDGTNVDTLRPRIPATAKWTRAINQEGVLAQSILQKMSGQDVRTHPPMVLLVMAQKNQAIALFLGSLAYLLLCVVAESSSPCRRLSEIVGGDLSSAPVLSLCRRRNVGYGRLSGMTQQGLLVTIMIRTIGPNRIEHRPVDPDSGACHVSSGGPYIKELSLNNDTSFLSPGKNRTLHLAARMGDKSAVEELLNRNTSLLTEKNIKGNTPLHLTARISHVDVVEFLIYHAEKLDVENGGVYEVISMRNMKDDTPLHEAVRGGHHLVTSLLVKKVVEANHSDFLLRFPCVDSLRSFAKTRLFHCASPRSLSATPAHLVAECGRRKALITILNACPHSVELLNQQRQNILHVAAQNGSVIVVKCILSLGEADDLINEPDKDGNTPLHLAAMNFHSSVVRCLALTRKVDIKAINNDGKTALDVA
ncbi:E3 ubiquitin-protein ligase MIB2 [Vitis vinifera]|uniref:E3 ubiquitin-protein ligase MIB2 n=1 Tax=Vitis vinifera TaxID=29760 RepID=A0A438IS54_VITVI|nr:E3 ubiquitin-protein ligase MIB2 [Vitis vinifera]